MVDLELEKMSKNCENFINLIKLKKLNNLEISKIDKNFISIFGSESEDPGSAEFQETRTNLKFVEPERNPKIKHHKLGTVGTVNGGQSFYITLREGSIDYLDERMTVIGYVEEGIAVVRKLNEIICDHSNCPFNPIRIRHAVILDGGEVRAPDWFPSELPESPEEVVDDFLRVAEDEDDVRVIREREREAKAKAQEVELELLGDLPSADLTPPKNVLFVCKLNPITEDEDLQTVFSRFGRIKNCDIIRDFKTGESLQYAFIEYFDEESCNKAYVSMQNVLIDDRRIKVDFSQSVSKQWNQFRQRQHMKTQSGVKRETSPPRKRDRSRSRDRYSRR